jgi:hypothetical protein
MRTLGLAMFLGAAIAVGCVSHQAPSSPPAPPPPPTPTSFRHPGILVNVAQLELVRQKVQAGAEPWSSAFEKLKASKWAALSWTPSPREIVECGPYSKPDLGCVDERDDAVAAYTHALLFRLTGDTAHARKAIEILNAWPGILKDHTNHNAPLQTAWTASVLPRAAELVRHTYDGWAKADLARFETMLRDVYLPKIANGSGTTNGNWELSMIEATMAIAVFTDDRALFDRTADMWRRRVPAYFYLESDGPQAVAAPGGRDDTPEKVVARWYGQAVLKDGVAQETCRDLGHTQYGLAAAINAAEIARQQGVDLYGEQSARLRAAMELHAGFLLDDPVPEWLCGGKLDRGSLLPTWEIAYNHFAVRNGQALPRTAELIRTRVRTHPRGLDAHFILWETLTHADVGATGLPTSSKD